MPRWAGIAAADFTRLPMLPARGFVSASLRCSTFLDVAGFIIHSGQRARRSLGRRHFRRRVLAAERVRGRQGVDQTGVA